MYIATPPKKDRASQGGHTGSLHLVKFGLAFLALCKRTDRQTNRKIRQAYTILHSSRTILQVAT